MDAAVRLSPTPPALRLMTMTRQWALLLKSCRARSRCTWLMEPSRRVCLDTSTASITTVEKEGGRIGQDGPTPICRL